MIKEMQDQAPSLSRVSGHTFGLHWCRGDAQKRIKRVRSKGLLLISRQDSVEAEADDWAGERLAVTEPGEREQGDVAALLGDDGERELWDG